MKIHSSFPQDGDGLWIFLRLIERITTVFARNSTNCEKQNTKSTGHFPEGGRPVDFLADYEAMGWLHTLLSSALFQHSVNPTEKHEHIAFI